MHRHQGVPATELETSTIKRELKHLYEKRADTFFDGSAQALDAHTARMLELEREYASRRPDETAPAPSRTRAGSRRRAGQAVRGQLNSAPRTRTQKRKAS